MVRPRPSRGERRIDAAIDHLAEIGFPRPHIRKVINDLLKLYTKRGWILLEEGQYHVVLEKLLEEQAQQQQQQQDQQPEAAVAEEALPENDMQVSPDNHVQFSEVQNVLVTNQSQAAFQSKPSQNSSPPLESVLSRPPAVQAVPARPVRPPCYGWISEESDTESDEDEEVFPDIRIPSPQQSLPFKRKRTSRWDVGPN